MNLEVIYNMCCDNMMALRVVDIDTTKMFRLGVEMDDGQMVWKDIQEGMTDAAIIFEGLTKHKSYLFILEEQNDVEWVRVLEKKLVVRDDTDPTPQGVKSEPTSIEVTVDGIEVI